MRDAPRKPTILIVDDTPENLDVLKAALIDEYMVRPALNGALALRLAAMEPQPDLILLDIMMPDMDGLEVCRRLKREIRTQEIPVIFVTARSSAQDEVEGLQLGAVDYIIKPISPPIVKTRVRTQLAIRHFNREMEEKNRRLYEINERLTDSMEQLSSSEERFRGLVQTIPDIVYKIDSEGNFTFLNKSIERLGYHQSDLIGRHFTEIIHSADIPDASLAKVLENIGPGAVNPEQKVFDERRSGERMTVGMEIRLRTKTGKVAETAEIKNIDAATVGVEVNSTGLYGEVGQESASRSRQYIGTVGVIRDVTERQKVQKAFMEERKLLRQLIDAVPLPIFFLENHERMVFSNSAFRRFTDVDGSGPEGASLADLFGEEGKPLLSALLDDADTKKTKTEIELKSAGGQTHSVDLILSKFHRSDQDQPAVIGVLVDVTERNVFTAQLIQARKQAEEASRAKGDFLANMSHEIRTPLNAVIGLTHLCMQTGLTGQQRDYLGKVSLSANALLSLLNDILDLSKIEAGKMTMEQAVFSLDEVIGGVVAIMSVKSQEKRLEMLIDTEQKVPGHLVGDAHRLRQVLTNLVGNAIKFTEAGEVAIHTSVVQEDQEGATLRFTVQDTGIGMTGEQIGRLFQEFSQGDASTTRTHGGTGLGLAISKRLIELMGGQVGVESTPGRGSRFSFTARFGKAETMEAGEPAPAETVRDLRILVVDDNESARKILVGNLERLSCHPATAESGQQALEALAAADGEGVPFDLVLMDWRMPGMNGLETLRQIRSQLKLDKPPRVIMVTAYARQEVVPDQSDQKLLDGFLMKPITRSALFETIAAALGHASAGRPVAGRNDAIVRRLAGARLLLVEDNEINQQVARELLQQVHIQVTVAHNGHEAVVLAGKQRFDGILMDLQMPVMDGLEATRAIRREQCADALPIIAMTANAMAGDRERCLAAGMNDHVAKPVVPEELYATLAQWVLGGSEERHPGPLPSAPPDGEPINLLAFPPLPGVDVARGLRNFGGNAALYREVVLKFSCNQGDVCQRMEASLHAGDNRTLERTAHTLKGLSATIGADRLACLAGKLEQRAKISEGLEGASELLGETASELLRLISAIATTLPVADQAPCRTTPDAADVGPERLEPLFNKAVSLLSVFDSAVEGVVGEISPLASGCRRRERLAAIREAIAAYDFEAGLSLFQEWAAEEGIRLKEPE